MRSVNRSAILNLIRREGPLSRSQIADRLEVSLPTVMRIIDALSLEGLVCPTGIKEWSGGRKRSLIQFNAAEHLTIGIDLGGTKMYGAVSDLGGNILKEMNVLQHGTKGELSYQKLTQMIDGLLAFAQGTGKAIRGIGIGVPGVTYPGEGIVEWAPSLEWRSFPLKARLVKQYNLPVIVDNDVNLSAVGEMWFGAGQNVQNLVLIAIGTGIGAGIVIGGNLYRGAHMSAGEIGYLLPDSSFLGKEQKLFGALEQRAAGVGIAERAKEALKEKRSESELMAISAEDVFDAARMKEPWAVKIIEKTIDDLAMAVIALTLCFDPDLIVMGGGVSKSADLLIPPIFERIDGSIPAKPKIVASVLGIKAAVMGAIINLLHNTADFYEVHKLD